MADASQAQNDAEADIVTLREMNFDVWLPDPDLRALPEWDLICRMVRHMRLQARAAVRAIEDGTDFDDFYACPVCFERCVRPHTPRDALCAHVVCGDCAAAIDAGPPEGRACPLCRASAGDAPLYTEDSPGAKATALALAEGPSVNWHARMAYTATVIESEHPMLFLWNVNSSGIDRRVLDYTLLAFSMCASAVHMTLLCVDMTWEQLDYLLKTMVEAVFAQRVVSTACLGYGLQHLVSEPCTDALPHVAAVFLAPPTYMIIGAMSQWCDHGHTLAPGRHHVAPFKYAKRALALRKMIAHVLLTKKPVTCEALVACVSEFAALYRFGGPCTCSAVTYGPSGQIWTLVP